MNSDITKGSLVKSIAGRDAKRIFVVLEVCDEIYLSLADGGSRKLENPKKKKGKHVEFFHKNEGRLKEKLLNGEHITNAELRRTILSVVGEGRCLQEEG